jgi:hypothetical protein
MRFYLNRRQQLLRMYSSVWFNIRYIDRSSLSDFLVWSCPNWSAILFLFKPVGQEGQLTPALRFKLPSLAQTGLDWHRLEIRLALN